MLDSKSCDALHKLERTLAADHWRHPDELHLTNELATVILPFYQAIRPSVAVCVVDLVGRCYAGVTIVSVDADELKLSYRKPKFEAVESECAGHRSLVGV